MKIVTVVLEVEGEFDMDPQAEKYPPVDDGEGGESLPCAMLCLYAHAKEPEIKILSVDTKEAS